MKNPNFKRETISETKS